MRWLMELKYSLLSGDEIIGSSGGFVVFMVFNFLGHACCVTYVVFKIQLVIYSIRE